MKLSTQPYKGARDFYPSDMALRNYIFNVWKKVAGQFGYEEYDGPLLEPFELFEAKSGTELINEQLYSFTDRGDRKIAIRPEMTPTLARMVAGEYKTLPRPIKWFSIPSLWRYEKPQRGRLREFFQLNVDVFGVSGVTADFEILTVAINIMKGFGAKPGMFVIKLNNRRFVDSFFKELGLDATQSLKLKKLIDKKDKMPASDFQQALVEQINMSVSQIAKLNALFTSPLDYLETKDASELKELFLLIKNAGLEEYFLFDPSIMRGLDYYTGNVFEQFDLNPTNTRAMYGGGRYDDLVKIFTGEELTGIGFGMGDVTLMNFLESWNLTPKLTNKLDYFITLWPDSTSKKDEYFSKGISLSDKIREKNAEIVTSMWLTYETPLEKQLKYASRKNALFSIIIGESELKSGDITIKNMETGEQKTISEAKFLQSL